MIPPRSHRGVELKSLLVSARREDTVAPAAFPLQFEGPTVPGTADTEAPVRQHLDVSEVEGAPSVGTAGGGGWGRGESEVISQWGRTLYSPITSSPYLKTATSLLLTLTRAALWRVSSLLFSSLPSLTCFQSTKLSRSTDTGK